METAFREHYDQLGDMLYQLLKSKEPQERQVGQIITYLEYENLVTALKLALEAQVSILQSLCCSIKYLDTYPRSTTRTGIGTDCAKLSGSLPN